MLTKPNCEQRKDICRQWWDHLQAPASFAPINGCLSPEGYHGLSSAHGSNVGQNFLTLWS
jgi:hypothetical protein